MALTKTLREIFRNYVTDGVPPSGVNPPSKADIRQWGDEVEQQISVIPYSSVMTNGKFVLSVASNALTIALKTLAGNDPSAVEPVTVQCRSATLSDGAISALTITSALALTITSGSTLGAVANKPFHMAVGIANDGGTPRIAASRYTTPAKLYEYAQTPRLSSTAEGGAGAADSANTLYTGTAFTSKPFRVLALAHWTAGLAVPGTWGLAPDVVEPFSALSLPAAPIGATPFNVQLVNDGTSTGFYLNPLDGGGVFVWDASLKLWKLITIKATDLVGDVTNIRIDGVDGQAIASDTVYQVFGPVISGNSLVFDLSAIQGYNAEPDLSFAVLAGSQIIPLLGMLIKKSGTIQGAANSELLVSRYNRKRVDLSANVTGTRSSSSYGQFSGAQKLQFLLWPDDGVDLTCMCSIDVATGAVSAEVGMGVNSTTVPNNPQTKWMANNTNADTFNIHTPFAAYPGGFFEISLLAKQGAGIQVRSGFVANTVMKAFTTF